VRVINIYLLLYETIKHACGPCSLRIRTIQRYGFALAARLMRRKYGMMQAVVILPDAVFDVDYLKLAEHAFGADHDHLIVISIKTNSSQNISQQIARGAEYCSPNASIRGVVSRQQPGYVLATVSTGASTTKSFLSSRKAA
jgi:hypothetical protein